MARIADDPMATKLCRVLPPTNSKRPIDAAFGMVADALGFTKEVELRLARGVRPALPLCDISEVAATPESRIVSPPAVVDGFGYQNARGHSVFFLGLLRRQQNVGDEMDNTETVLKMGRQVSGIVVDHQDLHVVGRSDHCTERQEFAQKRG